MLHLLQRRGAWPSFPPSFPAFPLSPYIISFCCLVAAGALLMGLSAPAPSPALWGMSCFMFGQDD